MTEPTTPRVAQGRTMTQDPIRNADTNPDTWLHASDLFEPLAAAQCYPHVFMTLLEDLAGTDATVGDLTRALPDDDWLDFLRAHAGIIKCEPQDALKFFADEIVEQMLHRIKERYPVTQGYSPLHIAFLAVYRAMRAAHDELEDTEIT
jgi:hypothetical protein